MHPSVQLCTYLDINLSSDCVVLNTGCSLSAIQYEMSPTHDKSSQISYTSDTYCTCIEQTFVNQKQLNNYDRVLDSQPCK